MGTGRATFSTQHTGRCLTKSCDLHFIHTADQVNQERRHGLLALTSKCRSVGARRIRGVMSRLHTLRPGGQN